MANLFEGEKAKRFMEPESQSDSIAEIVKRAMEGQGDIRIKDNNVTISVKGKTSQNARNASGKMQTEDTTGDLPSNLMKLLNKTTSGGMNKGGGRDILDQIAGFIAEASGGRGVMGRDALGNQGLQQPPLADLLAAASGGGGMPPAPPMGGGMPPAPPAPPMGGGAPAPGGMPPGMMEALMSGGAPGGAPGGGMPPAPPAQGGMPPGMEGLLGPLMAGAGGGKPPIPGRAMGGPVAEGEPYMVGEQGPEVMVPETDGEIIPNKELGVGDPEAQLDSIIDQVMQTIEERGVDLLGPDGKLSAEALQIFMEVIEGMSSTQEPIGDPLTQQMGGGETPDPSTDPVMAGIMSGAGGGGGAPMPDMAGGGMAPDVTGETPGGPDDISALLAALGG